MHDRSNSSHTPSSTSTTSCVYVCVPSNLASWYQQAHQQYCSY
ncbi:hypothetical protein MtrunA17_Chr5g0437641 [Medicago truncatula]|uniref:Uncharacterized protein n=1 Tax=Medicago truncatula TaxID=3880 RepID=A0A396HZ21_MEDTR|nr:hypothetical protein MtrunA17_Chr5g0437641 [Medicago truncatula]